CNGKPQVQSPTAEQIENDECTARAPIGCPTNGKAVPASNNGSIHARENRGCWSTQGRHLFVVDAFTGELIAHFDDSVFGAPVVGGVSVFTGKTGTLASAAYTTDADGVIWRIDISSADVSEWSAEPLFDMFWTSTSTPLAPALG